MDGTPDEFDLDDDGDGIPDVSDTFPLNPSESKDTDGDGIGDNSDLDDDNDGFLDIVDANPKYPGFYLDPALAGSQSSSDNDSGTKFAGGIAVLLLFTTTIAMALIFGARKLMLPQKKDVALESATTESNGEVEIQ